MKEQPKQYLILGQDILIVGQDNKAHKAKIIEIFHRSAVRAESLDGKHTAICDYSETGEIGTFSFPTSATASAEAEKQ
jgi:hypothetical protein